jgi:hypothetical protein
MSIHNTGLGDNEGLVCSPKRAQQILDIGNSRFYELLNAGEFTFYKDGKSTKVVVKSLYDYVERKLSAAKKAA